MAAVVTNAIVSRFWFCRRKAKSDFLIRNQTIHIPKHFSWLAIFPFQYREDDTLGQPQWLQSASEAIRMFSS